MKKISTTILIFMMCIPFIVNAESCDSSSITIDSIEIENITGNVEEMAAASVSGKKINLDLKLYNPGDSIEYTLEIKNTSEDDFYLDEDSLKQNTDYLEYEFIYDDNSNIIKAQETKTIKLRVEYKNEISQEQLTNNSFVDTNTLTLKISKNESDFISNIINNPETGNKVIPVFIVFLIVFFVFLKALKTKMPSKYLILIIGITYLIPLVATALCSCDIEVEAKIEIGLPPEEATYYYGRAYGIKVGDEVSIIKIENEELIAEYGDSIYILNGSLISTDYNVALNECSDVPLFFGFKIEDNIVTGISIECQYEGNRNALIYGPSAFESNKAALTTIFGESNCYSYSNYLTCAKDNYRISGEATIGGDIVFSLGNFGCNVNNYGTNCALD